MQIVHDIGVWLSQQPAWLSDCARRLLTQVTLSPDDKAS